MQFEPWQTHVTRIFRFFSATQCCSCGKTYCFESVWFIRRSETFYGNRGMVVCQRCASTAEEAYSIATRGPHIQPGRENKKDVWLLVREVERIAGDLGHSLGYPESNGTISYTFMMRCKICGASVKIIDSPRPGQDYIMGDLCKVPCSNKQDS